MCPKCKETVKKDDLQLDWSDVAVISFDSVPTPSDIDACASLTLHVHAHDDDTDSNNSDTNLDLECDERLSKLQQAYMGKPFVCLSIFPPLGTWARVNFKADISDVSDDEED